jgi:hypothetical protein
MQPLLHVSCCMKYQKLVGGMIFKEVMASRSSKYLL